MNVRTTLKLACVLSLVAVGGCDVDPEITESDLELAAEDDQDAEAPAEATRAPLDAELDFSAPVEDGLAAQCFVGETRTKTSPSGTCGGCLINGSYPGQKSIHQSSYCKSDGNWSTWTTTGTSCADC